MVVADAGVAQKSVTSGIKTVSRFASVIMLLLSEAPALLHKGPFRLSTLHGRVFKEPTGRVGRDVQPIGRNGAGRLSG